MLILCEGLEREEFLRSRITRAEVTRLLLLLADGLAQFPRELRATMPELDCEDWRHCVQMLRKDPPASDEVVWFAVQSLTPAALMWLRHYRQQQPGLFRFVTS